jgi:hypothetical protein
MDDLDLIETKAHAFIEEAKDLDSLAKAANILRDADERRKIRAELNSAKQAGDRAASERTSEKVRFWTAPLLPTLAFMVTAGTFLVQMHQSRIAAQAQEDSQWRLALERITVDPQSAPTGVLEMESFFDSKQYRRESRPVAAALLPRINDVSLFDVVFFQLLKKTTDRNQQELITLARAMTQLLQERHEGRLQKLGKDKPTDPTFAHFLKNPEDFYDDSYYDQREEQYQVDTDKWKLDTICSGLIELWKNPHFVGELAERDLTGIAFFTTHGDYTGVDFRGANLSGTAFYGDCKLDGAKFDRAAKYTNQCEPLE